MTWLGSTCERKLAWYEMLSIETKKKVVIIIDLNHWVSQLFFCLTHYYHLVFAFQETLISSLVFPHFPPKAINVFLAFVIALICVSELTLVRSLTRSMFCNQYCRLFGLRMTLTQPQGLKWHLWCWAFEEAYHIYSMVFSVSTYFIIQDWTLYSWEKDIEVRLLYGQNALHWSFFYKNYFSSLNSIFVVYSLRWWGWKGLKLQKIGQHFQVWSQFIPKIPKILMTCG